MQQDTRKRPYSKRQRAPGAGSGQSFGGQTRSAQARRQTDDRRRAADGRSHTGRPSSARQRSGSGRRSASEQRSSAGRHSASGQIVQYPGRPVQSIKRRRARRRRALFYRGLAFALLVLFLVGIFKLTGIVYHRVHGWIQNREVNSVWSENDTDVQDAENPYEKPDITVSLLEINPYSRPGDELKKVKNIFVHYTANQGTSAEQNRSYFANLADTGERSASAHFIIGYNGEILQCIPLNEEAYAVKGRNDDSVSIECCYLSEDGKFTSSTRASLIELLAWLCGEYGLTPEDILRHYDEGGKKCPLYYVEHEEEWEALRDDVARCMEEAAE